MTGCPIGDKGHLREAADSLARESLVMSVLNVKTITPEGLPKKTVTTPAEREAYQLSQVAGHQAVIQGAFLAKSLERISATLGTPPEHDLAILLSLDGKIDQRLCRSLAHAFTLFWQGDYETCVYLIVPRIEAAARALLRELDESIFRIEAGKDSGGYIGLYTLLDKLESIALDESWAYFLRWLLVDQFGQNIRNDVAHGLTPPIHAPYAALVLRAAILLIGLVAPQPAPFNATPTGGYDAVASHATRGRDELVRLLRGPVSSPVPFPRRHGHIACLHRWTASLLLSIAGKLVDAGNWVRGYVVPEE